MACGSAVQHHETRLHELVHLAVAGVQQLLHRHVLHPAPQPAEHPPICALTLRGMEPHVAAAHGWKMVCDDSAAYHQETGKRPAHADSSAGGRCGC